MRWVRVDAGGPRLGVLAGDDTVHLLGPGISLLRLLRTSGLDAAARQARATPARPLDGMRLLAPLPDPPAVRDFMAFEQHVDGVSRLVDGTARIPDVWYDQPLFYFSNPASVLGPHDDVAIPPGSTVFDAELEVAAVIGDAGRDLTVAEAEDHIAGYLILNDWSARDLQFTEMRGPLGPCKGKDSALGLGPWFVTADELAQRRSGTAFDLAMTWSVNGEPIGGDRLDSMSWSFAEMAAYASRGTTLRPGDLIGSGTCGGGCLAEVWGRHGRDARPPLRAGDLVELRVEGLGATANRITAAGPVRAHLARRVPTDPATWPLPPERTRV